METNIHYPVADVKENGMKNDNFKLISINKIIFDKGMFAMAQEKFDDLCKGKNIKKFKKGILLPLQKWEKVSRDFEFKKPLDPIKIKKFKNTDNYEVVDGRHRVMLSYYHGYTMVPFTIME